jgi:hypothetical protein
MADLNKSTVVIASVLKPVDDPRMYEKIGFTLSKTQRFEVHIIGMESAIKGTSEVKQHSFKPFRRVSLGRLLAPWRIAYRVLRLKPSILIFATHELLYLAMFVKLITGCKVIYDVQENYYWNILYTPAYPLLVKPFVALYVRGKETLMSRFVDHFFLAEKGYEQELSFPGERKIVLENKVLIPPSDRKTPPSLKGKSVKLIFTGTLAESTGVFTAIDLAVKLHILDERFKLTIIGFCAQPPVLRKIQMLIKPRPFIALITSSSPVPHTEIFSHIKDADFGLITYQINPSTMNSIPTKLYEYLGFKLPIILVNHKPWVDFCYPYSAAVVFDSTHIDAAAILKEMMEKTFYTAEPDSVYWEAEEGKLLSVMRGLV